MINEILRSVCRALVFIWPGYVANAVPVIMAHFLPATHPLDFGRYFIDGRRILGDGKTIEGFVLGITAGSLTGYLMEIVRLHTTYGGVVLAAGSMIGDSLGSFLKRRIGLERGAPAPLIDQLTFLVIALILYNYAVEPLLADQVFALLVITPVIHRLANYAAYKIGIKDRPW